MVERIYSWSVFSASHIFLEDSSAKKQSEIHRAPVSMTRFQKMVPFAFGMVEDKATYFLRGPQSACMNGKFSLPQHKGASIKISAVCYLNTCIQTIQKLRCTTTVIVDPDKILAPQAKILRFCDSERPFPLCFLHKTPIFSRLRRFSLK